MTIADQQERIDDDAVDKFARAMKLKLRKKRAQGYGGWEDCAPSVLQNGLYAHLGTNGDPIDVANFCMMIWHRNERIRAPRLA